MEGANGEWQRKGCRKSKGGINNEHTEKSVELPCKPWKATTLVRITVLVLVAFIIEIHILHLHIPHCKTNVSSFKWWQSVLWRNINGKWNMTLWGRINKRTNCRPWHQVETCYKSKLVRLSDRSVLMCDMHLHGDADGCLGEWGGGGGWSENEWIREEYK